MEQPERLDRNRRYTLQEYYQLEAASDERHEYLDGYIIPRGEALAMSGGSFEHSIIIANLLGELRLQLRGKPCRTFESNLRVRIGRRIRYVYPDLGVYCGEPALEDIPGAGQALTNPRVIFEVLSPSTADRDRGAKFDAYREIESLEEYVLVSSDAAHVQSFLRQPDGTWSLLPVAGIEAVARIRSLQIDLPLAEIYASVKFEPPFQP
jgi:Uma2 family endonuclease